MQKATAPPSQSNSNRFIHFEKREPSNRLYLLDSIAVGSSVVIWRTHRNGIEIDGIFQSTRILDISHGLFLHTLNSVWIVLPLENPPAGQTLAEARPLGGQVGQCRHCETILRKKDGGCWSQHHCEAGALEVEIELGKFRDPWKGHINAVKGAKI